ncbi:hypothetical protein BGX28_003538 [Mortierella sp. GBA30]|nr:hypothetical protein BGX28_003538 [Mortierella sp. GBA30]
MGQLEASCFAQGSDNALYALAYGYDLSITNGDNAVAALLKSNASPSSPNALTWQLVSSIRKGELFSFGDGTRIQCLADPNGGFLAWSYSTYRPGQGPVAQSRPGGFRYDPSLSTSSATTTGKGGWVNVETPLNYSWTSTSAADHLFYLKDGSGKYTFYHAFIPISVGTTFYLGVLNTATTPNMMENSATKWSVGGNVEGMKITATKLFVWGVAGGSGSLFGVADLPQSGPLPTTAPSLQLGNYTTPVTCSYPGALGDKIYKYCPVSDTIAGIFGDSSTTYMLVQSGRLAPGYGASGFGSYLLKAVALMGAAAGSVLDVPNNITVQDNIAFYASATAGEWKAVTGLGIAIRWVIGVLGFLFSLSCVIGCVRAHRRRKIVVVEKEPTMLLMETTTTARVICV